MIDLTPPPDLIEVPTLGTAGLIGLILLLAGLGFTVLRRRKA